MQLKINKQCLSPHRFYLYSEALECKTLSEQALSSTACPTLLQDAHMDPTLPSAMSRVKEVTTRMHITCDCVMCPAVAHVQCRVSCLQHAQNLICQCATISDEPLVLLDL